MAEFAQYGYIGLFAASFIAATVLPMSSEAVFLFLLLSGFDTLNCIVVASIGNWLGGMTCYYLGRLGNWQRIEKYLGTKQHKVMQFYQRIKPYGAFAAFFCWLPFVGDAIAVGTGFFRLQLIPVALWMLVGKTLRYGFIAFFGA